MSRLENSVFFGLVWVILKVVWSRVQSNDEPNDGETPKEYLKRLIDEV